MRKKINKKHRVIEKRRQEDSAFACAVERAATGEKRRSVVFFHMFELSPLVFVWDNMKLSMIPPSSFMETALQDSECTLDIVRLHKWLQLTRLDNWKSQRRHFVELAAADISHIKIYFLSHSIELIVESH
jgi:hypothetical protein